MAFLEHYVTLPLIKTILFLHTEQPSWSADMRVRVHFHLFTTQSPPTLRFLKCIQPAEKQQTVTNYTINIQLHVTISDMIIKRERHLSNVTTPT
jgi:hypothetical protein